MNECRVAEKDSDAAEHGNQDQRKDMHAFELVSIKPVYGDLDKTGDDGGACRHDGGRNKVGFCGVDQLSDEGVLNQEAGLIVTDEKKNNWKKIK